MVRKNRRCGGRGAEAVFPTCVFFFFFAANFIRELGRNREELVLCCGFTGGGVFGERDFFFVSKASTVNRLRKHRFFCTGHTSILQYTYMYIT